MRILFIAALTLVLAGAAVAQTHAPPPPQQPPQQGTSRSHQSAPNASQADMLHAMNEQMHEQGALASVTCRIGNIAVLDTRVHVHCAGGPQAVASDIQGMVQGLYAGGQPPSSTSSAPGYFAVGLQADPALANLVVSLATQAAAQNKQVQILYRVAPGGNPPGCQPNDCRRLIGIVMLVQN